MLTKRDALMLLAMMPLGSTEAAEAAEVTPHAGGGLFLQPGWDQPMPWTLDLTRVSEFVVERGGRQIKITADEVWAALGGDAAAH